MGTKPKLSKLNLHKNLLEPMLQWIEKAGNRLPDPVTIFVLLCFLVVIVSGIAGVMGISVIHRCWFCCFNSPRGFNLSSLW